ncbi:MAG: magnesium transporter [Alphaproteobacteria bacterium]
MTAKNDDDDAVLTALVRRYFINYPKIAAQKLDEVDRAQATRILSELPIKTMIVAWEALRDDIAAEILVLFSPEITAELARIANTGKLAILLSRLETQECDEILARMGAHDASELRMLMSFPPDTAGRLMDTHILALSGAMRVSEAVEILRPHPYASHLSELKIVDDNNKLQSIVSIRDFALATPDQTLDSLAGGVTAVVYAMDPREEVVEKFERYRLEEMAVIDPEGLLLGVIRQSELIGALKETATLDMQTMVGVSKDERATSSSWFALRKRMPWLQINLLTAFMAAAVVGLFEGTIAKFTALAVLLPVVAGQSGNAGAQALAVTMRGLALREIRVSQWLKVTRKEVNTGFWNGIAIAITCGAGVYFWSGQIGLVFVIASSMIIAMVAAGTAGALVPITLKRLGQDPAVASSIILTTVTDIVGFFSFLGIATLLSGMLS